MRLKHTLILSLLLLPAFGAVPTPESHFGHKIGVDNELLDWDKVVSYFQALEKSSDRSELLPIGVPMGAIRETYGTQTSIV